MTIVLWILIGLLALVSLAVALMKLVRPKEKLAAMGDPFAWTADFSQGQIRLIAVAELLGAVGLVLPGATGILPWVSGIAAVGIAILQVGAIVTHLRRGERAVIPNIVIVVLAVVVAVLVFLGY
ncbi:hypothetical protein BH09ACT5_BH09ACT5_14650 [soil metagenome]